MGTYTGLRFTARLTPAAADALEKVYHRRDDPEFDNQLWPALRGLGLPICDEFLAYERKNSIPYGWSSYMPRDWSFTFKIEGNEWSVCCSYKDIGYHDVLMTEVFLNKVLPVLISEECTVEYTYEEWKTLVVQKVLPVEQRLLEVVHES